MESFLAWANNPATPEPALLKAGMAHLWLVTLHPFGDGNGRIARAVGDLFLARVDGAKQRYYSLSTQIQRERKGYHEVLEQTQKGTLEVTGMTFPTSSLEDSVGWMTDSQQRIWCP